MPPSSPAPARPPVALALPGLVAAVLAAVFIVYWPALHAGFIWDDEAHVTAPGLRSWGGLGRIWSELGATQQYYPLLHSAFWFEHRLWGSNPLGYHLANVLLHGAAAILLAVFLQRLALRGAWLAALIFAVHPVHVESVAWISEQKNTLSTLFFLAAALAYLRFDDERDRRFYWLALSLFVLGLLTKTVIATLPAALLVVFWWRRGRLSWRGDVLPLTPWFALGAAAGLFTAWVERNVIGADGAAFELTLLQRGVLAGRVAWFYATKLVWPENLTFTYPRWEIDPLSPVQWLPLAATGALLVVLWRIRHRSRAPLAAALLFGGLLFPVLGFFNVYPFQYSFVADHFQYLASIPLIALGSATFPRRISAALLLLVAFAFQSWQQSHLYHDNTTLFRATTARNPASWMAFNNLGRELMANKATLPQAIASLQRALALRPDYAEAHNNLGLALTQSGRAPEGIPHLEAAVRLKPRLHEAHNNLGIALASSGRAEEALPAFAAAAALRPTLPNIQENWAKALLLLGRRTEAGERFARAAELRQAAGTPTPNPRPSLPKPP